MIIKFKGYRRGKYNNDDNDGDIFIMKDGTILMSTNIDTSEICFSYYGALLNLETFKVASCRDRIEFNVEIGEYDDIGRVISAKDLVFVKLNINNKTPSKYKGVEIKKINTNTIDLGDILVFSDNRRVMIVKIDGSWYGGLCLKSYKIIGEYSTINGLLEGEFLEYRGTIIGTRTDFIERKRIVEVIKSEDILLTYKRRFLEE